MEEVEVGGKRGVVMLLRLRWRHQRLLRLWRHQCRLRLWWRHQHRLLLRLRLVVLESVEVVVWLRRRHEPTVRVAVLLLLRVVVIHLPLATPAHRGDQKNRRYYSSGSDPILKLGFGCTVSHGRKGRGGKGIPGGCSSPAKWARRLVGHLA